MKSGANANQAAQQEPDRFFKGGITVLDLRMRIAAAKWWKMSIGPSLPAMASFVLM